MSDPEAITLVAVFADAAGADWGIRLVRERQAASDWLVLSRRSDGPEQGASPGVVGAGYAAKESAEPDHTAARDDDPSASAAVGATLGGTAGMLAATYVIPGMGPLTAAHPLITTLLGAGLGSFLGTLWQSGTAPPADQKREIDSTRIGGVLLVCATDAPRMSACRAALAAAGPLEVRVYAGGPTGEELDRAASDESGVRAATIPNAALLSESGGAEILGERRGDTARGPGAGAGMG